MAKHPLKFYVEKYGIALGTIQNCVRKNWPLDDPTKLLEKFLNSRGLKPNLAKLQDVASGGRKLRTKRPGKTTTEADSQDEGVTLQHEFERIKSESARSYREYLAEKNPATRIALQKIWLANSAALRQLAKPARQSEVDLKNWLQKSDVEASFARAASEFRGNIENLGRRISALPLFAKLDPVDVELACAKETKKMLDDFFQAISAAVESGEPMKSHGTWTVAEDQP